MKWEQKTQYHGLTCYTMYFKTIWEKVRGRRISGMILRRRISGENLARGGTEQTCFLLQNLKFRLSDTKLPQFHHSGKYILKSNTKTFPAGEGGEILRGQAQKRAIIGKPDQPRCKASYSDGGRTRSNQQLFQDLSRQKLLNKVKN